MLAARWVLGDVCGSEIVDIAEREFARGSTSKNLAALVAYPDATAGDCAETFLAALTELGIDLPAADEASRVLYEKTIAVARERFSQGELFEPWAFLEESDASSLVRQLASEVSRGHPLFKMPVSAFAHRSDVADTVYELLDGTERVAEVHLTYGGAQRNPWPATDMFESLAAWREHALTVSMDVLRDRHEMLFGRLR